jgi:16S rRNA processing protein RimM
MNWDDMVLVGIVARTHGNRGEVIVNLHTDFAEERFQPGATLVARRGGGTPQTIALTSVRFHQGRPILGLAGVDSISAAEELAGAELRIPATAQGPLPEGFYYHHELVGCEVITAEGQTVGQVVAVEGEQRASRLVVRGRRREVLIPLAADICEVDVATRRIVVTPPQGLLELNGDWR